MSEGRRGGERRQHAPQSVCTRHHAREIVACVQRTRPSLGPSTRARQSSLRIDDESRRWWGGQAGITVGQTRATERNQHWGWFDGRSAARHTSLLSQGKGVKVQKKRKEIEVSVPARIKSRTSLVWLLARRIRWLQKSVGDNSVSNKLGKRTPKRVAGSSERGPSSERRLTDETVGKRVERMEVASRA